MAQLLFGECDFLFKVFDGEELVRSHRVGGQGGNLELKLFRKSG